VASPLLHRAAQNDAAAVKAVLETYGGLVWSLARRFCINQADAEDAVQEVFVDVWRSAARYDPAVASEATFIAMIARRRLIDRARRSSRRPEGASIDEAALVAPAPPPRADIGEEAAIAADALNSLSEAQQRVLRLSIYRGLSHEEIAQSTGLPLGTVKTHCRRGLIRIRQVIEEKRGAPSRAGSMT
jgi:RNA polymerase sigma-70 factor (ECF subfamily)